MQVVPKTSRAVLFYNNQLITIKRTKFNKDDEYVYYTMPGGHVEKNETFQDTVKREIKEELGIDVKVKDEVFSFHNKEANRYEKFYECEYLSGTLGTGTGDEFTNIDYEKYGKFEIENIILSNIESYNILPHEIKEILVSRYKK